jgi:hypothetical protein
LVLPLSRENILAMVKDDKASIEKYLQTSSLRLRQVSDYITVLEYQQSLH